MARLLTAWSAAGILGAILVNYLREYQLAHGVPKAQVYNITVYVLAALKADLSAEKKLAHERELASQGRFAPGGRRERGAARRWRLLPGWWSAFRW